MPVQLEQGYAMTRNVSATGIYFVTDVVLEKGGPVSFTLDFKDYPGGLRVKCTASVVRVEQQRNGKIGVGAAITAFEFNRVGGSKDEPV